MPENKQITTNFKSAEELFYNPVGGCKPDMIVDGLIPTGLTIITLSRLSRPTRISLRCNLLLPKSCRISLKMVPST